MVVKLSAECRMSHQHVFFLFFLQFSKKFQNDDLIIVEALNSEPQITHQTGFTDWGT